MDREQDDPRNEQSINNDDYRRPRRRSRYEDSYQDEAYEYYEDEPQEYPRAPRQQQRPSYRTPTQSSSPTLRRVYPRDKHRRPSRQDDYDYEDERNYKPRQKRTWPALLGGCVIGILITLLAIGAFLFYTIHSLSGSSTLPNLPGIPTTHAFSQKTTRSFSSQQITQITQIVVCDPAGNVTLTVSPTQTNATVQTTETVHEANQSNANKKFQQFAVEIQPPDTIKHTLSCPSSSNTTTSDAHSLVINTTLPGNDTTNNSADLTITLPSQTIANNNGPSTQVTVNAARGNIFLSGLSGSFNLQSNTGNITVKQAILTDGSQLATSQGTILFTGFLSNTSSNNNASARYTMQSEHAIDVTLLDANTNAGAINSDFPFSVQKNGSSASYNGPLNPSIGSTPTATLILDVSIGNVTIHKLSTP
jgi:hypothetical protein